MIEQCSFIVDTIWFVKYLEEQKKVEWPDASMEQYEFRLMEEAEGLPDIDWSIIENISNGLRGGAR